MQDGSTVHWGVGNMALIEGQIGNVWGHGVWPANSPDLNPTENLWSILKDSLQKPPIPTNLQSLQDRFQSEWKNLNPTLLDKLSQSFKNRIESMLKADGGHTTC
jgi:hypothetical protein